MNYTKTIITPVMENGNKEVKNFSNLVDMRDNTIEITKEPAMTTALVLYKEPNNPKGETRKKRVMKEKNTPTLAALQSAVKAAKEKLEQCTEREKEKIQKQLARAKNAYRKKLQQTVLPMPVEFWVQEPRGEEYITKKEVKEVIIAQNPSFCTTTRGRQQVKEIYNNPYFEKDAAKYMTSAQIYFDANITLTDLNNNPIQKGGQDVLVPVCSAKEQLVIQLIYSLNIEAMVEGEELIPITNVQTRTFGSLQDCAKYEGTNLSLDRGLNGKEKIELACLATQAEFFEKIQQVSKEYKMPLSTAAKYYSQGKKLTSQQWNDATRGITPSQIQYDLKLGDKIIEPLLHIGVEIEDVRKRYYIDALSSYANLSSPNNIVQGFDKALQALKAFTTDDIAKVNMTEGDKVSAIVYLLKDKKVN